MKDLEKQCLERIQACWYKKLTEKYQRKSAYRHKVATRKTVICVVGVYRKRVSFGSIKILHYRPAHNDPPKKKSNYLQVQLGWKLTDRKFAEESIYGIITAKEAIGSKDAGNHGYPTKESVVERMLIQSERDILGQLHKATWLQMWLYGVLENSRWERILFLYPRSRSADEGEQTGCLACSNLTYQKVQTLTGICELCSEPYPTAQQMKIDYEPGATRRRRNRLRHALFYDIP